MKHLIVPVWAKRIAVQQSGEGYLVHGEGHIRFHPPADNVELDLFRRLKRYFLGSLTSTQQRPYEFADAASDERLVKFLEAYGPIQGTVLKCVRQEDGTLSLTVRQSMQLLRREQEVFLSAVDIVRELNRNSRADLNRIRKLVATISQPQNNPKAITVGTSHGEIIAAFAIGLSFQVMTGHRAEALENAHAVLCHLFDRYHPVLIPHDGQAIELPRIEDNGILPALYVMLRADYLGGRHIAICQNCGNHFLVIRKGVRGCSESCNRAMRNRRYYEQHGEEINKRRRDQRGER